MNWLLYFSGWYFGFILIKSVFVSDKKNENIGLLMNFIMWTMSWIWVCWTFVAGR
jgi:hypothetical protein